MFEIIVILKLDLNQKDLSLRDSINLNLIIMINILFFSINILEKNYSFCLIIKKFDKYLINWFRVIFAIEHSY